MYGENQISAMPELPATTKMLTGAAVTLVLLALFASVCVLLVVMLAKYISSLRTLPGKKEMSAEETPGVASNGAEGEAQKMTLAEALKNHREECHMTQEFVAEALGVSRQAVSKWETGASEPSTSNLLALAKIFGISAAELLKNIE